MIPSISFVAPIHTINESNGDKGRAAHWMKSRKRKQARETIDLITRHMAKPKAFPVVVRLTRLSAGVLDDDGLRTALKSVRDGLAQWCGVDDGDTASIMFDYAQDKCRRGDFGVLVEVFERARLTVRIEAA